ncbi:hypothetical protein PQX77_007706 [Marasmius sp. AFHP31]|nr:hypothetical protein PQX77_007706 [Marasmius sp. AFHP31]
MPERQGRGADFHRSTKAGASITFNWLGTAIYVYGNATKDSYRLSVDGQNVYETFDVPEGGLLGSMTGMQYEEHTAMLEVVGGKGLAFQYADLTIGLGYPGKNIANRTVQAVVDGNRPNPFFDFRNDSLGWVISPNMPIITFPNGTTSPVTQQMVTYGSNDGLSFTVTSANAFILWGSPARDHPVKRITISPKPGSSDLTSTKETFMFDVARYLDYQQVLYWESGLDRETSYTVEILPFIDRQLFAFNELQLLDGGSPSSPSSSPPSATDGGHRTRHLSPANITVIASRRNPSVLTHLNKLTYPPEGRRTNYPFGGRRCGGTLVSQKLGRRAKEKRTPKVTPYMGVVKHDTAPPSQPSSTPLPLSRETDVGLLPPQYQLSWTGATIRDGNAPTSPTVETSEMVKNGGRKWIKSGRNARIR